MTVNYNSSFMDNKSSRIEFTTAEDFDICDAVMNYIDLSKNVLTPEEAKKMEYAFRGFSHKMQLIMTHRIITYWTEGRLVSTGVKHADIMVNQIIDSFPEDIKLAFRSRRSPNAKMVNRSLVYGRYDIN